MIQEDFKRRVPLLDTRLLCIAGLVPTCDIAADIGADHGRLSCHLLANNICRHMIVSDISPDSLSKSRHLLALHSLDHRADFVVADGLDAIMNPPVDAVVIAGMGGRTIADILKKHDRIGNAKLIVSAHTDNYLLRQRLFEYGFCFEEEVVIRSNGRFYTVLTARRGQCNYTQRELYIGPTLSGDCLLDYLEWRKNVVGICRDRASKLHLGWLIEEINNEKSKQSNNI